MTKTRERLAEADLVLVVLDASGGLRAEAAALVAGAEPEKCLYVLNKSDLRIEDHVGCNGRLKPSVLVSALTGSGIDNLTHAIASLADRFQTNVGTDAIAINARHSRALAEARQNLESAQAKLRSAQPVELLASDLRAVLAAYGEITGKIDNERMLDQLFATFCIGK
jgi:tRNA modification GTPase